MYDLKISILGKLDTTATKNAINKQIEDIQKNINKLNISVNMNGLENAFKQFEQFNKNFASEMAKTKKVIEETTLSDGTRVKRTYFDGVKNEFSQIIDESKKVKNSIDQTTGSIQKQNEALNTQIKAEEKILQVRKRSENERLKSTSYTLQDGANRRTLTISGDGKRVLETYVQDNKKLAQIAQQRKDTLQKLRDINYIYSPDDKNLRNSATNKKITNLFAQANDKNLGLDDLRKVDKEVGKVFQQLRQKDEMFQKLFKLKNNNGFDQTWISDFENRLKKSESSGKLEKLRRELELYKNEQVKATKVQNDYNNALRQEDRSSALRARLGNNLSTKIDSSIVGQSNYDTLQSRIFSINPTTTKKELQDIGIEYQRLIGLQRQYNSERKTVSDISKFQRQATLDLTRISTRYTSNVDGVALDLIEKRLKNLNTLDLKSAGKEIENLRYQIKKLETESSRVSRTFGGQLGNSFEKVAQWGVVTSVIYGSVNAFREMLSVIIQVDTQMTELHKVLDQGTNFDKLMQDATISANAFGQTLTATLDSVIEFSHLYQ